MKIQTWKDGELVEERVIPDLEIPKTPEQKRLEVLEAKVAALEATTRV